jgi:hypothetical protein
MNLYGFTLLFLLTFIPVLNSFLLKNAMDVHYKLYALILPFSNTPVL